VAAAGTASYDSGTFTIKASGADIWGTADEFRFAYRAMTGNGTITARVSTVQNVSVWTKAGVMMRESLAADSKQAAMFVSSGKGLAFQRRTATGGISTHTAGASQTAPYWVRLTRSGSTFSAYSSPDGTAWTLVGTDTISMASTIYVGLAVTSHVDGTVATVSFTNVATP
jgi:regulation of enolase protein 1 (concanavalin A-like superfamily)